MKHNFTSIKSITLFIASIFLSLASSATSPQGINYQAVLRNNAGTPLPNQHINLRFTIHSDSLGGPATYKETDTAVSTPDGIFTVVIGGGNIIEGNFENIPWATSSYYLQVELDAAGGSSFVNMGTTQLVSVPYSLYSKSAGSLDLSATLYPTVTGNDSIIVGSTSYIVINSAVTPSAAVVALSPGAFTGQVLCVTGSASMGNNGVRFENMGLLQLGSGGPNDLQAGSVLTLMWSGTKWLRMSFSGNQ